MNPIIQNQHFGKQVIMKRTKHRFNMIELVLAIGVAAIGITSIMALIPLALRSSRDSVGDTVSADAANTIFALIDNAIQDDFDVIHSFRKMSGARRNYFNDPISPNSIPTLPGDQSYLTVPASITADQGHFHFYYGQKGKAADFNAEVNIWRVASGAIAKEVNEITSFKRKKGSNGSSSPEYKGYDFTAAPDNIPIDNSPFVRLLVEVSWPATVPYYLQKDGEYLFPRNSRVFIREYFDPNYTK